MATNRPSSKSTSGRLSPPEPGSSAAQASATGQAPPARRGDTRERILDVALDLFNDQGYDKTSLREVAEELGVTKAALYYHFARKEDILLALHTRIHDINLGVMGELEKIEADGPVEPDVWLELIDRLVEQVIANRKLFALHVRNHDAIEELHDRSDYPRGHGPRGRASAGGDVGGHDAGDTDPEAVIRRLLSDPRISAARRIAMACSLGAVLGTLLGAGGLLGDVSDEELVTEVRKAVRQIVAAA